MAGRVKEGDRKMTLLNASIEGIKPSRFALFIIGTVVKAIGGTMKIWKAKPRRIREETK